MAFPLGRSPFLQSPLCDPYDEDEVVPPPQSGSGPRQEEVGMKLVGQVKSVKASEAREKFTVLVHLKAPKENVDAARAPVDLVTVLDVSGSMHGVKLELVKTAMEFVIRNLRPQDRLSLVSFSDNAYVHLPLKLMTDEGRKSAMRAVEGLQTLGGTEIGAGLGKGFEILSRRKYKNPVASLMLLSDGMDNIIQCGRAKVVPVEAYLPQNQERVAVHTFGFGYDHDPVAMHSIAEATGGSFCYVEQQSSVQHAFAQCIGGLLSVVADSLKVTLQASSWARISGVQLTGFGTSFPNPSGEEASVSLGSLYADEERDFLVEMSVPVSINTIDHMEWEYIEDVHGMKILSAGGTFKDPSSDIERQLAQCELVLDRPEEDVEEATNTEVDRQINRVLATRVMSAARGLADSGDFGKAKAVLEEAKRKLEDSMAFKEGDALSRRLVRELGTLMETMNYGRQHYQAGGRAVLFAATNAHANQRSAFACAAPQISRNSVPFNTFGSAAPNSVPFGFAVSNSVPFSSTASNSVPFGFAVSNSVPFSSTASNSVPFGSAPSAAPTFGSARLAIPTMLGSTWNPPVSTFGLTNETEVEEAWSGGEELGGCYTTPAMERMVDKSKNFKSDR